MHCSISFVKRQRPSDRITMAVQEFLDGVIETTCSNKVEVGSKAFKFCNEAIADGIAKYNGQFPLDVSHDDFILQVLCHSYKAHKCNVDGCNDFFVAVGVGKNPFGFQS